MIYSGHIGDDRIFLYDVESIVKVCTGEEDCSVNDTSARVLKNYGDSEK